MNTNWSQTTGEIHFHIKVTAWSEKIRSLRIIIIHELNALPVLMRSLLVAIQLGIDKPIIRDRPRTKRFLLEFRSTNCRLDKPTAVTIPITVITSCTHVLYSNSHYEALSHGYKICFKISYCNHHPLWESFVRIKITSLRWETNFFISHNTAADEKYSNKHQK